MSESELVGTWQLVSVMAQRTDGTTTEPYGHRPRGAVVYGPDGRVITLIVHQDLEAFESESIAAASAAEASHAFRRTLGYFGRYEADDEAGTVTHHIEACTFPNWMGEDEVRHFMTDGSRLTLTTPPLPSGRGGDGVVFTLLFERADR